MGHPSSNVNDMKTFLPVKLKWNTPKFFNISSNNNTPWGYKSMTPSDHLQTSIYLGVRADIHI